MANARTSDSDVIALQCLLDTFPSSPLELIASAFTQANGDPDLAAEIITFSIDGIAIPATKPSCKKRPGKLPQRSDGITGLNETSRVDGNRASNGASGIHDNMNLNGASSVNGSRVLNGVSHAHGHEASSVPGNRILNETAHAHGESHVYGHEASHVHGNEASSVPGHKGVNGASGAKQLQTYGLLPRPRGPCPPTLEEYFPPPPEKKAWVEPLTEHLQKNDSVQSQQNTYELPQIDSSDEFPCLGKRESNRTTSALPQTLRSSNRSSKRISVASGLVSNARTWSYDNPSSKASPSEKKGSENQWQETTGEEKSTWPTETEAFLLSKLGDGLELGIEAVRDVLGHYEGDVEKSMEVLLQMGTPSISSDHSLESASESRIIDAKDSNLSQYNKVAVAVGGSADRKESGDATKVASAKQMQPLDTYHAFEKEILKQEGSSMKWVVERLCNEYPHADMATLLEVLRATNFNYNDADKMLQEAGLQESGPDCKNKIDPHELSSLILESLFIKPQEENKEQNTHAPLRQKNQKDFELSKKPKSTSSKVGILEHEEASMQMQSYDMAPKWKAVTSSEVDIPRNEEADVQMRSYGDWDDYERHHSSAKQHWKTMKSYFKAATVAYADQDPSKAELLTEKGNTYKQLAMEARERANNYLMEMKSQQSESDVTLDLQEQHVTEAFQLLRLHLKSLSAIPSCHTFTVITGPSKDANSRHKKVRHAVVQYLEKKEYEWVEMSPFCLQIQLKKMQL